MPQPAHHATIPHELPVIPLRDLVVFPHMVLPLFVGRELSRRAIEEALQSQKPVLLLAQRSVETDQPQPDDLFTVGTVAQVMRALKLPDGRLKILVQGLSRAKVEAYTQTTPFLRARITQLTVTQDSLVTAESEVLTRHVRARLVKAVGLGGVMAPDALVLSEHLDDPGRLSDTIISNIGAKVAVAQTVLETLDPIKRLRAVDDILVKEIGVLEVQRTIQTEAKSEIDRTQREYFLREQAKAIQRELGELDERGEELADFRRRMAEAKMPEQVQREAEKQLKRLEKMHPDSAEATTVRTYLEWFVELPWAKKTKDRLGIAAAQKVLDEDHFDLEKVKERILEYLAVRRLKKGKQMKGPILCFVGPPGVGKTSLGKSVARALGRAFVRLSLGGVRDEAEIRGHRRTYIGALPGRIIQGIKQAGTNNPVLMMDEVDKLGYDFRGDPSAALLEVLDPEQNHAFVDHYLAVPFDLSDVMFITTANLIDPIPRVLRDRMEVIELAGYTEEEKVGIACRYLIPKQLEEHGMTAKQVRFSEEALRMILTHYTREAGVRNLERAITTVLRKVAKKMAEGKGTRFRISPHTLHAYLGVSEYQPEAEQEKDEVGVATGLAWTEAGGEIIHVEATIMRGKGSLTLTGHLGDVMKESAQAALSYVRSRAHSLKISPAAIAKHDIHIHVPAGAIPKDGPSAGITMATALASALTGIPVRRDVAMTGEVTLRGRVLQIGGLKEKVLAAKRHGFKIIILPKTNEKKLEEIPASLRKDLRFVFVETVDEVMATALGKDGAPRTARRRR